MNGKLQINLLLQLCKELLASMLLFQQQEKNKRIEADFFDHIRRQFSLLDQAAFKKNVNSTTIQHMKYALAAFFDEIVLSSNWPYRSLWMMQPLQMEFFDEHLAGEGFFKRLNQLRQDPFANIELLEVFYVCLQLGFEGMYRMQGLEKLAALQVDLCAQIETIRGFSNHRLSTVSSVPNSTSKNIKWRLSFWLIGSVTLAIVLLIYSCFTIAIDQQAGNLRSFLSKKE